MLATAPHSILISTSAPYDPINLDRSRRQAVTDREVERERRRVHRLYYYCVKSDHRANICLEKSNSPLHLNVRTTSPLSIILADSTSIVRASASAIDYPLCH